MRARYLLVGGLVLLIAVPVALFFFLFERYTKEVDRGWSTAARRNPYLAAEQFLAATGHRYRYANNISVVSELAASDTLFVAASSQVYNSRRAGELLEWIERGGSAIVVAQADSSERDWLLEQLGVTVQEGRESGFFENPFRDLLGEDLEQYEGKSASEILREHNRKLREGTKGPESDEEKAVGKNKAPRNPDIGREDLVVLDSGGDTFQLHFDASRLLYHPALENQSADGGPVFWAKIRRGDRGVPFMQFRRGEGLINLLADGGIWENRRIGHFDHAYFLALLASDGELVFLTQPRFDTLVELVRRYCPEFFLAGGLTLLAWLLFRTRRFGPLAPEPETARRSLLEHISACGHYYWRADGCGRLLAGQRRQLLRRLGGERADKTTRRRLCIQLSAETGLSESDIAACLWGGLPCSEEGFTEQTRNLQQIEAVL